MKTTITALCLSVALAGSAFAQDNTSNAFVDKKFTYTETRSALSNIQMSTVALLKKHGVTSEEIARLTVGDMINIYQFLDDDSLSDSAKKFHIQTIFARRGM